MQKAPTQVKISASTTWTMQGSQVELRATVSRTGGDGLPFGTVAFQVGKRVIGLADATDGVAVLRTDKLPVGDQRITAYFRGGAQDGPSVSAPVKVSVVKGTSVDVMVLYTPQAMNGSGGSQRIRRIVANSVADMNLALLNSRVPVLIRLVYTNLVNYRESGKLKTDLRRLASEHDGYMDEIHDLRDRHHADLVSLFEDDGDLGGLAYELTDVNDNTNDESAFSVVLAGQAAAPYYALAHELGHNLGATHDAQHSDGLGATNFSAGWRFRAGGVLYHDIMAYDPGETIPYFSSPRVKYQGVATGSAGADSARTITFAAPYVARYR